MSDHTIIEVKGISKKYYIGKDAFLSQKGGFWNLLMMPYHQMRMAVDTTRESEKAFWALKDISFNVSHGERIGIIGRNGAGKSTLLKILSRLVYPTEGEARIRGRVTSLLEVGTGFNSSLTGRENVYLNASLYGLSRAEINEKFDEIVEFSGIGKFLDTPVKCYSSGMYARLAFAVAAHLDPDILMLDEVLAVGDMAFQQKCLKKVEGLTSGGRTVLFVSHSMSDVVRFCERAIWLDEGRVVIDGPAKAVCDKYMAQFLKITSSKSWESKEKAEVLQTSPAPKTTPDAAPAKIVCTNSSSVFAPDRQHVRILSVRTVNDLRETIVSIPVNQPVGIEMEYEVLIEEKILLPAFAFYSEKEVLLFVSVYTDPEYMTKIKPVGRYRSTTWIPAHFLNVGVISISASITSPGPKLERHVVENKAIQFYVLEAGLDTESAAGLYREVPGAVRPKLKWETQSLLLDIVDFAIKKGS